jgi:hypothetical protein
MPNVPLLLHLARQIDQSHAHRLGHRLDLLIRPRQLDENHAMAVSVNGPSLPHCWALYLLELC